MLERLACVAKVFFKRHPFVTNCTIYGALYMNAELMQQHFSNRFIYQDKDKEIDYKVVRRFAFMGTFIYGPTLYAWYKWLDNVFPGTAKKTILKKLALDQCILTPICITLFYTGMSLMEGNEDAFAELREKFMPTFARSCCFWLPAQTLNFAMIAPRFRITYMGLCGVIWINILCWMKRENLHTVTGAIITAQPLPEEVPPKESVDSKDSKNKKKK